MEIFRWDQTVSRLMVSAFMSSITARFPHSLDIPMQQGKP